MNDSEGHPRDDPGVLISGGDLTDLRGKPRIELQGRDSCLISDSMSQRLADASLHSPDNHIFDDVDVAPPS